MENRWEQYCRRYRGRRYYLSLAPVQAALSQVLISVTQRYLYGRVLDAGAGGLTYAFLLTPRAEEYISIDVERTHPSLDIQGDVAQLPFEDESIDTVFCAQVLEHVPQPWQVMREFARVLRPGGRLLLTVPHLAYLHGLPHDYFRYTHCGLASLAAGVGMTAAEIRPAGGLLCFLAEPLTIAGSAVLGGLPGLSWPTWVLSTRFARTVAAIDRYAGFRGRYPVNWVGVFVKASGRVAEGSGECESPS